LFHVLHSKSNPAEFHTIRGRAPHKASFKGLLYHFPKTIRQLADGSALAGKFGEGVRAMWAAASNFLEFLATFCFKTKGRGKLIEIQSYNLLE
jgi:hypothetical protein